MRVLHVMESTIGGTRRHIVDVARGQQQAGLDVHLAVAAERTPGFLDDLQALRDAGIDARRVPMQRAIRPLTDLRHARVLAGMLRELRPDVVHTHSSKGGALGRLASLRTGIGRRVHTPHTFAFLFSSMFSAPKRALFRGVERYLGARTDRMVAVSRNEADTIARSGVVPEERIRVVPNGIDPARWLAARPIARAAVGVPEGAPLATLCGLLNVAKGQDLALRALALAPCRDVHLLIAGEGETEGELRALARSLGVDARVRFLGWRGDVPELVAASDVVLLPSRWEGLPYIVLEAMAAARPVVATRVDGARELVEDGVTGYLVALDSPAALADAVGRVLALPSAARRALGETGRERVLARYTAGAMVRGLIDVYEELR